MIIEIYFCNAFLCHVFTSLGCRVIKSIFISGRICREAQHNISNQRRYNLVNSRPERHEFRSEVFTLVICETRCTSGASIGSGIFIAEVKVRLLSLCRAPYTQCSHYNSKVEILDKHIGEDLHRQIMHGDIVHVPVKHLTRVLTNITTCGVNLTSVRSKDICVGT
jgi:hypothetical protein